MSTPEPTKARLYRGNQPIMEKLKRIRVEGFRSFRDVDVEFGNVTVLIGANGSGKSNFISFFQLLNFMLSESLQLYVGRRGGATALLHYGPRKSPVLQAELEFVSDQGKSEYGFSLAFASPDGLLFTDEHVGFQTSNAPNPFKRLLGAGHLETKLLAISRKQDMSVERRVAGVFVHRLKELQVYHFHDTSEASFIRTSQDVARNRELLSHGGNLAAFLYMLQQTKPQHFERILRTIQLIVPYLHKLVLEPDRLDPRKILLRWSDKSLEYEFGPHQLSDGSLRAIAMVTALLQPEELLPGVIFIDEPELGLHPSAIGIIASLVREVSSKRQVIIATQSPGFLAHFSPEEVIVVERREDNRGFGESTCKRLSKEDLSAWLEEFNLGELYERNVTGGWPQ